VRQPSLLGSPPSPYASPDSLERGNASVSTDIAAADSAAPQAFPHPEMLPTSSIPRRPRPPIVANPSLLGLSLPPDALERGNAAVSTGIVAADSRRPRRSSLSRNVAYSKHPAPSLSAHRRPSLAPRLGLASRQSPRRLERLSSRRPRRWALGGWSSPLREAEAGLLRDVCPRLRRLPSRLKPIRARPAAVSASIVEANKSSPRRLRQGRGLETIASSPASPLCTKLPSADRLITSRRGSRGGGGSVPSRIRKPGA